MLARIQKIITLSLLCASVVWAAYFASHGRPVWAGLAGLLILLGYALFLGLEFVMLYAVQQPQAALRANAGQLLRAWWGEVIIAPRIFFWRQPFRSNCEPDNLVRQPPRHGVVLVHGFFCNRGFWRPWLRELRARQVPFIAVNLEPVFGSLDQYPQLIEDAVARLQATTALPVVLVGHSMGGLAIRAWLKRFNADARVHRVITIGTPHQGTWLARLALTANGRQMRLNSPWLVQLAAGEPPTRTARFTCFYSHCDNIAFPAEMGMLPGAENLHVPGIAHVHIAFQEVVFNEVWRWLDHPPPASNT